MDEPMMTVSQIAALLQMHPTKARTRYLVRWEAKGLKHIGNGRGKRYRAADIKRHIDSEMKQG